MCCKGFFKRLVPFFLTFAVGILVASIFVPFSMPSLRSPNRGHRERHSRFEFEQLRQENEELKREIIELREARDMEVNAPFVDLDAPPPPKAPRSPRFER